MKPKTLSLIATVSLLALIALCLAWEGILAPLRHRPYLLLSAGSQSRMPLAFAGLVVIDSLKDVALRLSDDEGRSWKWKRSLELDNRGANASSFHYPSLIQTRDGLLHASYSYFMNHLGKDEPRKTIKHATFNVAWVKATT